MSVMMIDDSSIMFSTVNYDLLILESWLQRVGCLMMGLNEEYKSQRCVSLPAPPCSAAINSKYICLYYIYKYTECRIWSHLIPEWWVLNNSSRPKVTCERRWPGINPRQQVECVHYSAPNTGFMCESGCRHSAVIMGGKCHLTTEKRQAVITLRNERLSYREKLSKNFKIFELCGLHHQKASRKWQELYLRKIWSYMLNIYTALINTQCCTVQIHTLSNQVLRHSIIHYTFKDTPISNIYQFFIP